MDFSFLGEAVLHSPQAFMRLTVFTFAFAVREDARNVEFENGYRVSP
jgi:hypothetical protein